ncbi:MAG: YihY/virulence factor BrkB family protein [Actinomycetia bacterium]|nr:YihY/virulence factor BrkB family protein [Actinomycetes bacterium]MCP5032948.1 YihY/virulence factor BrkB family protein [Actinomycetes bacterium]
MPVAMLGRTGQALGSMWRFVRDVALRWYHGGVGDLAAGVTFWILVSLPASILVLLSALGALDAYIDVSFDSEIKQNVLDFVDRVFINNEGISDTVEALFKQSPDPGLLTVSVAVTLWSVSRGFAGLIRALDDIYEVVDGRPWYHTRVVAVILGIGSLLISVPLVMLERLVWEPLPDGAMERILRSVVAMTVLATWALIILHYGPARRSRLRHDVPGAIVAAALWWLLTAGFGFYVSLTSPASDVTAAVGAALLALTWIWMAAQVLLIGGTVNFLYGQRRSIARERNRWGDRFNWGTGEIRKIVVNGHDDGRASDRPTAGAFGTEGADSDGGVARG